MVSKAASSQVLAFSIQHSAFSGLTTSLWYGMGSIQRRKFAKALFLGGGFGGECHLVGNSFARKLRHASMPGEAQQNGDEDVADAEADPDANDSEPKGEAEQDADRKADYPPSQNVEKHGGASVRRTSQGSDHHDLQAVEQLEDGGNHEQRHGEVRNAWIVGKDGDQLARDDPETERGESHPNERQRASCPA